jgi:hypothetical protein
VSNVQTANCNCPSTTDCSVDYEALLERFKAPTSAEVEALRKSDARLRVTGFDTCCPALELILDENLPKDADQVVSCAKVRA